MNKPDFKQIKELLNLLKQTNEDIENIINSGELQKLAIGASAAVVRNKMASELLYDIDISELKNSKAGIRVNALADAGYKNLGQLSEAKDYDILRVEGVGDKQLESIRNILTEMGNQMASHVSMQLNIDSDDNEMKMLLKSISIYRQSELIRNDISQVREEYRVFYETITQNIRIRNSAHWLFSMKSSKEETVSAVSEANEYINKPFFTRIQHLIGMFAEIQNIDDSQVVEDYTMNSADYYALLDSMGNIKLDKPLVYSSIPQQLAADIDAIDLDTSLFVGNLRSYQEFGAKYIIHQGKVLLGDEMGLGKTVQAIAAMSHVAATSVNEKSFFLIVCPASVLINWCREVEKFSKLKSHLIYGQFLECNVALWQSEGGVAVTNYESMGKIIDDIDNKMHLDMLIIDEAHYIKNPDAQRTQYIHRLDNESERILMMTGTPLENRVEEMCNLIDFVRPDMTKEVKQTAYMNQFNEFKQMLSPVYIRRLRSQVLEELPPVEERQVWCSMTEQDRDGYAGAICSNTFLAARRVGYLQDDIGTSSKAIRLKELCENAEDAGRKVVVFSYFRETISKVKDFLGKKCVGEITGSVPVPDRHNIIDAFEKSPAGSVLICQIQAGGTGLNIQQASVAIFCEPQIKPSLTKQAIARLHRMGQIRDVLVYHLLCENTVDEAVVDMLERKQIEFDQFAEESVIADAADNILDNEWISKFLEEENKKYLPMVVG